MSSGASLSGCHAGLRASCSSARGSENDSIGSSRNEEPSDAVGRASAVSAIDEAASPSVASSVELASTSVELASTSVELASTSGARCRPLFE
jgi:hypothetical protein